MITTPSPASEHDLRRLKMGCCPLDLVPGPAARRIGGVAREPPEPLAEETNRG